MLKVARRLGWIVCGAASFALSAPTFAGGGPLGIDHEWSRDENGIYSRHNQRRLEYGVLGLEVFGAVALGDDNPVGHEFWQAVDATALSAITAKILKRGFGRARPNQGNDPDRWFRGSCCSSFPSGEVTLQASVITPFIVNESREHPWVWALEILPAYDAIARLKSQQHWASDVIAGWALGTAFGYWSSKRETPLSVQLLPKGVSVGFTKRF